MIDFPENKSGKIQQALKSGPALPSRGRHGDNYTATLG